MKENFQFRWAIISDIFSAIMTEYKKDCEEIISLGIITCNMRTAL